jgi:serine/threonine protein kinase
VAHGDIKPNNFLVTLDVDDYGCIMADFGSCVVRGQDRVPTLSPPWNAPELHGSSRSLGFEELCQTDLFSLGLVCIHLLIPSSLLKDEGLWFVRQQQSDSEWAEFIDLTNRVKQPETIATSLVGKLKLLVFSQCEIPENHKSLLANLMENVMLPPNGQRSMPWDDIFRLVNDELSTR